MNISALLINHNSHGTILKSIQSLLDQDSSFAEIIVVDNASTDGGAGQIRNMYPQVQVIELHENHGLTFARNTGLRAIASDLVLLMDDDVYLANGALKLMIQALNETGATVVCPRIMLYPETETIQCDGAALHFAGLLTLRHVNQPVASHVPERVMTNAFIGACLLVNRKTLAELGNFDEDYFFYFEDMELSYRLRALGYNICCEERAVVFHERGAGTENLSFRGAGSYPARRAYYNLRHRWLTMMIHYQARTLILLSPALLLYESAALVESVRRGWVKEYVRAMVSLAGEFRSIMKRRRRWMSQRNTPDRDMLSGGDLPFSRGFVDSKRSGLVHLLSRILNAYWELATRWL